MLGLTMTGNAYWADKEQLHRKPALPWWQTAWQQVQNWIWPASQRVASHEPSSRAVAPLADLPISPPRQAADPHVPLRYGLRTSALALLVTTTGRLFYPPLQIAGLPLLIYMGIPAAQQAYDQLEADARSGQALAETVVLAVCLASGYYWIGSLGFWLYYGGRTLLAEQQPSDETQRPVGLAPTTTQLWKDGTACAVPTATLQPGDQVILHSGELAPADGLITEGVAWLCPQTLSATTSSLRKTVGDRVTAAELLVVGQIGVRVLPAA